MKDQLAYPCGLCRKRFFTAERRNSHLNGHTLAWDAERLTTKAQAAAQEAQAASWAEEDADNACEASVQACKVFVQAVNVASESPFPCPSVMAATNAAFEESDAAYVKWRSVSDAKEAAEKMAHVTQQRADAAEQATHAARTAAAEALARW